MWFVFAYWGNELLRHDGSFSSDQNIRRIPAEDNIRRIPFEASEYNEGQGSAIIVRHHGNDLFAAIRLPSKGRFHFAGFVVMAETPIRFVDVWEVRSLKVNGTTPLEQWLPDGVTSSATVEISGRTHSGWSKRSLAGITRTRRPLNLIPMS